MQSQPVLRVAVVRPDRVGPSTEPECLLAAVEVGRAAAPQRAPAGAAATPYEIVNLGNNQTVSLLGMVEGLEQALGVQAKIDWKPEQPGDMPQTWADVSLAGRTPVYAPATPYQSGARKFCQGLMELHAAPELA